jgi:hypothetical protein
MADYSSLIPESAVSPKELAQLWNCTVFQVYGWINYGIKRGDKKIFLEACRLGGSWVIHQRNESRSTSTETEKKQNHRARSRHKGELLARTISANQTKLS